MECHIVENVAQLALPGRAVKKSIGIDGDIKSQKMTFGRTLFSLQYGAMMPHHHAEEIIYVISTSAGVVRYGSTEACSDGLVRLAPDMVLHFADQEWHVFEFEQPDGFSDILFYYAQVSNIRPEE